MLGSSHGVTRLPYIITNEQSGQTPCPGGLVRRCLADSAQTLNIGDVVYTSAAGDLVSKSATVANYTGQIAGVVVGGTNTQGQILSDSTLVGTLAAIAGQEVLVQYSGEAYVVGGAAITFPNQVIASAVTAGRIASGTTAGGVLGNLVQASAAAGSVVLVNIWLH